MDDFSVDPRTRAGDPFTVKASLGERQAKLDERYRHELMDDEERQELRSEICRLHGVEILRLREEGDRLFGYDDVVLDEAEVAVASLAPKAEDPTRVDRLIVWFGVTTCVLVWACIAAAVWGVIA